MGFLDRAIQKGISRAVSDAVETGVKKAVAPKVEQAAANAVNSAAASINEATGYKPAPTPQYTSSSSLNSAQVNQAAATLGSVFGSYVGAAESYANEAAKNMKLCPSCGEAASADKTFCPQCGAKLPDQTVAQGALCPSCGTQNTVGTKFCATCGAKLPAVLAEEQAFLAKWDSVLPQYPRWELGGNDLTIEDGGIRDNGQPYYYFNAYGIRCAVAQDYFALLRQNGFTKAGKYPAENCLYKMIGGTCYYCDGSSADASGTDSVFLSFGSGEPEGGFNYVAPEKKQATSGLDDLKSGIKSIKGLFR